MFFARLRIRDGNGVTACLQVSLSRRYPAPGTAGFDALHRVDETGTPLHLKHDRGLYALIQG